jgi:hypothetical protein
MLSKLGGAALGAIGERIPEAHEAADLTHRGLEGLFSNKERT